MGTRSLVHFHEDPYEDSKDAIIVSIYRQMDGYYDGRGIQLAEWLAKKTIVNGIPCGADTSSMANGMGCLAAQWIHEEKDDGPGSVYIQAPGVADPDDIFIEYEYHVRVVDGKIVLEASGHEDSDIPFKGNPADFDPEMLKAPEAV